MHIWTIGSASLAIQQGDITTLDIQAIVNAANSRLAGGGGVDGAIHTAAGLEQLQAACQAIITHIGSLAPGKAVITSGFNLKAEHIIHTVGPIWRGNTQNEPQRLADAYRNSLELAHASNIDAIAFPAISCGVYGYPVEQASRIALTELRHGLERGLVHEARMVLHDSRALETWLNSARILLGPHTGEQ